MPEADHLDISHPTGATNPTTPIDAASGAAGGSQLLASRQWQRLIVDAGGDPWWLLLDGRWRLANAQDETSDELESRGEVAEEHGPVGEYVLVPVGEAVRLLAEPDQTYRDGYRAGREHSGADQLRAELAEVNGQRDRLAADLRDEVAAGDQTVHRLSEALAEARAERDRAQAELRGELVAGERTIRHLTDERDTARAERDQAVSDLRAAFAGDRTLRQLKGERDAARAELVKVAADRNVARSDLASVIRNRDAADRQVDRLRRLAGERRRELEVVGARAGWASLLAVQLRLLVQAVEQWQQAPSGPRFVSPLYAARAAERAAEQGRQLLVKLDQATAPPPATPATGTTLTVPDSPKALRETLCVAQVQVGHSGLPRSDEHVLRLERLIGECDRHRPLGPDGRHGHRHTPTCGCQDRPDVADALGRAGSRHLRTLDETRQAEVAEAIADGQAAARHEPDVGDHVQAQTLYAGLPNLPVEPAVADEPEPTEDQLTTWREHHDHTEGPDHG